MKKFILGFLACGLAVALALGFLSQAGLVHWAFHEGHGGAGGEAVRYQCPMHPHFVSDRQTDCPICGMRLVVIEEEEETPAPVPSGPVQYSCPMHPEEVSDQPGRCSQCGMPLEPGEPGPVVYSCPMHPDETSHEPGRCSQCGMPLEAPAGPAHDHGGTGSERGTGTGGGTGAGVDGYAPIRLSSERRQLMGIVSVEATRQSVDRTLRTYGRVAVDETRIHHVHTKFQGYVEELFAAYEGRMVERGEPLFTVYSPELYATQQEYLVALKAFQAVSNRTEGDRAWAERVLEASRRRLTLWDITEPEIAEMERTGTPRRTLTIHSPVQGYINRKQIIQGLQVSPTDDLYEIIDLSSVWVVGEVYETDLAFVRLGQSAAIELRARPGRPLTGRVSYIDPQVDPRSRTVRVRIDVPNGSGLLKPEMFAEVVFQSSLGEAVTVPENALLVTGERSLVFIDSGDGAFTPREVVTGQRTGDRVAILSGLEAGERVVMGANFLLDSESRLKAALSRTSHQH